jgi:2-polyprenyl-3-methyl-5-hydroxy-6-metoxy-1,4-benzoquinol methylase
MPWDDNSGDWQGLKTDDQLPRYKLIAELIKQRCPLGNVLDVGCGEGLLRDHLPDAVGYLGVEPSARASGGKPFICCQTAEDFDPGSARYDCVVFNEMLYYTRNPVGLLQKFSRLLTADGFLVVSIYQRASTSLRAKLLHLFDRRRPTSNLHCTRLVREYIRSHGWAYLLDQSVRMSAGLEEWQIFAVKPTPPDSR